MNTAPRGCHFTLVNDRLSTTFRRAARRRDDGAYRAERRREIHSAAPVDRLSDSGQRHPPSCRQAAGSTVPEALSRRRAVMLQRTALQADWTVETVIAMGRSPWGATADPAVLAAVMAVTGCDGLAGRRYPGLSGGEQQRVQLARCLAQLWRDGAPQGWLFLDEPTSALTLLSAAPAALCSNGSPPAGNCTSAWCCMTLTSPPCGPTASCCSTRDIWSPRARRRR